MSTAGSAETFAEYWTRIRGEIESELHRRIPQMFSADPRLEIGSVMRAMDGGKRIRGCLVCLMCNALGGDLQSAVPRAVGVECVQAASLIHDDYIDNDHSRRNRPAGWIVDGSRRAVLVGDVMFATAIEQMAAHGAEDGALIAEAIADMARGAFLEQTEAHALSALASGESLAFQPLRYDDVIRLKTGVLFAAAAKFGALAAGAPPPARRHAFDFGMQLGLAYQLADDLADTAGLLDAPGFEIAAMLELGPLTLRYAASSERGLEHLLAGGPDEFRAWIRSEMPAVRARVTHAIADHRQRAVALVGHLPESRFSPLLRDLPDAVTAVAL